MRLDDFLTHVQKDQIPPEPPKVMGWDDYDPNAITSNYEARDMCTKRGMWPIVDKIWTGNLAGWIGGRKVLEIMAGGGWIAKALSEYGVGVIATDDFSWNGSIAHANLQPVFPVQKLEASKAIDTIPADILLVSWPPYESQAIVRACDRWGTDRPIIYIGEGWGGCNAPDEFFDHFSRIEDHPDIHIQQWYGLHDCLEIGYWTRKDNHNA